ncbi:hypothetical protein EKO04_008686 [Ascochyta lentis]|uniref:Uncharacterized protein n=1 Tax=Ascochyta lentis TaxID=205686 RepID=A0A8H7IY91_9PLEO|nr:hypothetical protein EKO04_008686 [Ascochyta lentis]
MSQPNLPVFTWPIAAPGVQKEPPRSFSASAKKIVYVTVTSTILYTPTVDASKIPMIHQTQPLDLHASNIPSKIRASVPDVTVASFEFFTPPADVSVSMGGTVTPTKSNSGPTPDLSHSTVTPAPSPLALSPAAITGITIGFVAFIGILAALAVFFYRYRKAPKSKADVETPKPRETLEEKVERAREYQRKRWSAHETAMNQERFNKLKAKLAAQRKDIAKVDETFVIGDGEGDGNVEKKEVPLKARLVAARRPSGLAMHPPSPVDSVEMADVDPKAGRAK